MLTNQQSWIFGSEGWFWCTTNTFYWKCLNPEKWFLLTKFYQEESFQSDAGPSRNGPTYTSEDDGKSVERGNFGKKGGNSPPHHSNEPSLGPNPCSSLMLSIIHKRVESFSLGISKLQVPRIMSVFAPELDWWHAGQSITAADNPTRSFICCKLDKLFALRFGNHTLQDKVADSDLPCKKIWNICDKHPDRTILLPLWLSKERWYVNINLLFWMPKRRKHPTMSDTWESHWVFAKDGRVPERDNVKRERRGSLRCSVSQHANVFFSLLFWKCSLQPLGHWRKENQFASPNYLLKRDQREHVC